MEETTTAITAVKQEVQLRDWAAQIAAQQASGMTVQKWCAENDINPKTYYYHLQKLREKCVAFPIRFGRNMADEFKETYMTAKKNKTLISQI